MQRKTKKWIIKCDIFSSPLREEDEDNCEDLWDAASLDYPGNQSPTGWEFLAEEEDENNRIIRIILRRSIRRSKMRIIIRRRIRRIRRRRRIIII